MRTAGLILALLALAACGGGDRNARQYGAASGAYRAAPTGAQFQTSGPIYAACIRSGRKAANTRLCGCVQGVAAVSLSGSDQRPAAGFYADPHRAQVVRQSDNPAHESFWQRYKAYAARAERTCRGM